MGKESDLDYEFVQDLQAQLRLVVTNRFWIMPTYRM